MSKIFQLFNSRTFAVWLLLAMSAALALSTFLPAELYSLPEEWAKLTASNSLTYRLALRFSTPNLVKHPVFVVISLFLFLSTLSCTIHRVILWQRRRQTEFSTDRAFSFAVEGATSFLHTDFRQSATAFLVARGWECAGEEESGGIRAQRGIRLGFWGSIAFHVGLIFCFLAVPVSVLTRFNGALILTEGMTMPLREAVEASVISESARLPLVDVAVRNLWGRYHEGRFKVDFGGDLLFAWGTAERTLPFKVNQPVEFGGFQFSLQEYGFAPQVVISRGGQAVFDYFLNLRHQDEGDYFPLEDTGRRLFVLFFPDFVQEGRKIGSKSREPRNPRLLVKVMEGERVVHQALLSMHEEVELGEYRIRAGELRNWVNLGVTREKGLGILIFGLCIGLGGLFVRFLSNERRLELELFPSGDGTTFRLKGYSRYYPAFLEREVVELKERLERKDAKTLRGTSK